VVVDDLDLTVVSIVAPVAEEEKTPEEIEAELAKSFEEKGEEGAEQESTED
jgi:hypothetical protein